MAKLYQSTGLTAVLTATCTTTLATILTMAGRGQVAEERVGRAAATIRWSGMCDPPCNMRSPLHMRQLIAMRVRVYV